MIVKKVFSFAVVVLTAFGVSAGAVSFEDTRGHWAEDTINELVGRGIVDGITDTEFEPDGYVTRAQYLKMIMEATGVDPTEYRYGECLETNGSEWYAPYLQKALDEGLIPDNMIAGCKKNVEYTVDENGNALSSRVIYTGAFNGDLTITREEMAVLTQYFYQYTRTILTNSENEVKTKVDFTDSSDISEWARVSVRQAVANGFIDGMDNNMFEPDSYATRAQAATIVLRVINK